MEDRDAIHAMTVAERRGAVHAVAMAEFNAAREAARGSTPAFPAEWGDPVSQHWITVCDDRETVHVAEPDGPHLTVWRFEGFEATATFDIPSTGSDLMDGFTTEWDAVPPRGRRWVQVGPTTNRSTLWRRPLGRVVAFRKKEGQRNG